MNLNGYVPTHTRGPGTLSHGPNSMTVPADSMNEGPHSHREDQFSRTFIIIDPSIRNTETEMRKRLSTNASTPPCPRVAFWDHLLALIGTVESRSASSQS